MSIAIQKLASLAQYSVGFGVGALLGTAAFLYRHHNENLSLQLADYRLAWKSIDQVGIYRHTCMQHVGSTKWLLIWYLCTSTSTSTSLLYFGSALTALTCPFQEPRLDHKRLSHPYNGDNPSYTK